jgi:hypothetical protein
MGFSLDRVAVERRRIAPRSGLTFALPLPPAANNLFVTTPEAGRSATESYMRWKEASRAELARQTRRYFAGPVTIDITFEDRGRFDLENRARPILLAAQRFIADGSRATVRSLKLRWGDVTGCEVRVEPLAGQ